MFIAWCKLENVAEEENIVNRNFGFKADRFLEQDADSFA